ncbi:MAG: ABC transporter ATP-binding protein [Pseudomonadota bacterium]
MNLVADNIQVRYGGVVALDRVSVSVEPGRILAVVGPNGSGKTTLFNAITGLAPLAGGKVAMGADSLFGLSLDERVRRGISRTFQTPRYDPDMTLRETVLCGFFPLRRARLLGALCGAPSAMREARHMHARCDALIDAFGLTPLAEQPMGELPIAQIRLVDVARATAPQPRFLLLDEPAAGLSVPEQQRLAQEVRRLARSGIGVLLVEHNFDLVCRIADHLVVLERGKVLLQGTPNEVSRDPDFRAAYLGSIHAVEEQ